MKWAFAFGLLFAVGCSDGEEASSEPDALSGESAATTVSAPDPSAVTRDFDAAVYGASEGGIAAAITIARSGLRVALVDELDYIGGMSAAGTTSMDGNYALPNDPGHEADFFPQHPGYEAGFYKEFADRVRGHYKTQENKHVSTCYSAPNTVCFEPSVGRQIFTSMLAEAGVNVFLNETPLNAVKIGTTVKGFQTKHQVSGVITYFRNTVSLDGSDYGDLLAMTGARYRVGNSYSTNINLSACVSDNTYGATIRDHAKTPGVNPLPVTTPPGYTTTQTFDIPWWVMNEPPGPTPPAPVQMTPAQFFANCITPTGHCPRSPYPVNFVSHNHYRSMPDSNTGDDLYNPQPYCSPPNSGKVSKTNVNWFNDYVQTVAGIENRATRKTQNCEAKLRTLQFIHYLQSASGMNAPKWSVAREEGFATTYNQANLCPNIPSALKAVEKHMPLAPYVRESRRTVGLLTLNATKVLSLRDNRFSDPDFRSSLGFGEYGFDLHGCWTDSTMEPDQGESFWSFHHDGVDTGGPAPVPFGAVIPETIDGFLPANGKLISVSRVANGKYRHQPVSMIIGQAAGMVAAHAIASQVKPRHVNVRKVQIALLNAGAQIIPFTDVDNAYPYRQEVNLMALNGIMVGYADKSFGVDRPITRAQAAAVTAIAAELPFDRDYVESGYYSDVPPGHWAYFHVEALKDAVPSFTGGCGGNNYCPDASLTRAQLAVFAVKTREKRFGAISVPPSYVFPYPASDVPPTHFAYASIRKLAYVLSTLGLTFPACNGSSGLFCPSVDALRGEVAFAYSSVLGLKQTY